MREVVLDTETTGLDPSVGHRIVEIGCVELLNHVATGETWQAYINPERDMPEEAFAVHGLSDAFLADKPPFHAVVDGFMTFVGDSRLVIHNADFDLKFINAELAALDRAAIPRDRAVDTVSMARRKFPGAPASLDALCKRFNVDSSARTKHGALLDSELLAEVYLELIGGRQPGLGLAANAGPQASVPVAEREIRPPRPHAPTAAEIDAHEAFLARDVKSPIWKQ